MFIYGERRSIFYELVGQLVTKDAGVARRSFNRY